MFKKIIKFISNLFGFIGRFFKKKKNLPEQPEQKKETEKEKATQRPEKIQEHTEKKNKGLIFPY